MQRPMKVRSFGHLVCLLVAILIGASTVGPAAAHKDHKKKEAAALAQAVGRTSADPISMAHPQTMDEGMSEKIKEEPGRSESGFIGRLLDWLGRTHPIIVHFPVAFFPAALFMAVVGRRRPDFATPLQFLVVAGGIIAPISALLGWFNAGFSLSDADPLMMAHRWLGTAIGAAGLGLGLWAWRRPWVERSGRMIAALTAMTIAIAVQGWFGGALVHGIDHMNW